jgi:hypothetical protein
MKAIKFALLLTLTLLLSSELSAQYRFGYFRVGVSGGAFNYVGDLDDDFGFYKFTRYGGGINGTFRFNPLMMLRVGYTHGLITGDDAMNSSRPRINRNLSFRSQIQEFSAQLVIDFIPTDRRYMFRPTVVPYIFGGIGLFSFNPQGQLNDEWIDLQPLGTEGQWLADPENRYPEPYELTQVVVPLGGGLRFRLGRRWDMELEVGWRKTFTDYLDDVSGFYADRDDLLAANPTSAIMADRSDPVEWPNGIAGHNGIRGDNTQKDWYIYTSIGFSYVLDWVKCPTFR